jgi:hypothetical protein
MNDVQLTKKRLFGADDQELSVRFDVDLMFNKWHDSLIRERLFQK